MKSYLFAVAIVTFAGSAFASGSDEFERLLREKLERVKELNEHGPADQLKEIRRFQERYGHSIAKVKSVNGGIGITKRQGRWAIKINIDGSRDIEEVRAELLEKFPALADTPHILEVVGRIKARGI